MARVTELIVNGESCAIDADAESSLLNVLREQLDLTGSKYGCGEGQCGACTVLINGLPRKSCITPVGAVGKKAVTTIEGLEKNGHLHPVQQAFLDAGAFQCAFCTSGMIMTGVALLQSNPNPSEEEAVRFFESNICRCGTYSRIIEAVRRAAALEKGVSR
jgi:aerobic-type carbon monoxide dehydrogenase small subunit (CoxS/CutS family)